MVCEVWCSVSLSPGWVQGSLNAPWYVRRAVVQEGITFPTSDHGRPSPTITDTPSWHLCSASRRETAREPLSVNVTEAFSPYKTAGCTRVLLQLCLHCFLNMELTASIHTKDSPPLGITSISLEHLTVKDTFPPPCLCTHQHNKAIERRW